MKIGILSMQKVINYGSFLQAYGLKQLIGHVCDADISFIDIRPGINLYPNKCSFFRKLKTTVYLLFTNKFVDRLRDKYFVKKLTNQFQKSFFMILNLNKINSEDYDLVVIGSDEVFNFYQNTKWGYTTQLYGDIKNTKKVVTYAASFGATTLSIIDNFNLRTEISENLIKCSEISVRDTNSQKIIEALLHLKPEIHPDPVLVYDFSNEINDNPIQDSNYIIVYSYLGRIKSKNEVEQIVRFAKNEGLPIFTIFCRYKWAEKTIIPENPFQVLSYFKNAKYIITDTFHGTIFSIINRKSFCTFVRDDNKNKIHSLLTDLKLENRMVTENKRISYILKQNIDYSDVDKTLKNKREQAMQYLKHCINV